MNEANNTGTIDYIVPTKTGNEIISIVSQNDSHKEVIEKFSEKLKEKGQ